MIESTFVQCFVACLFAFVVFGIAKWQLGKLVNWYADRKFRSIGVPELGEAGSYPAPAMFSPHSDSPFSRMMDKQSDLMLSALEYGEDKSQERLDELTRCALEYRKASVTKEIEIMRSMRRYRREAREENEKSKS